MAATFNVSPQGGVDLTVANEWKQAVRFTARELSEDRTYTITLTAQGQTGTIATVEVEAVNGAFSIDYVVNGSDWVASASTALGNVVAVASLDANQSDYIYPVYFNVRITATAVIRNIAYESNFTPDTTMVIPRVTDVDMSAEVINALGVEQQTVEFIFGGRYITATKGIGNLYTASLSAANVDGGDSFIVRAYNVWQQYVDSKISVNGRSHSNPKITIDAYRCDANGDKDMDGGYLSVRVDASSVPAELGLSSLIMSIDNSILSDTSITNHQRAIYGNGAIDPDTAYEIDVYAADNASAYGGTNLTHRASLTVPKVARMLNFDENGTKVTCYVPMTFNRDDTRSNIGFTSRKLGSDQPPAGALLYAENLADANNNRGAVDFDFVEYSYDSTGSQTRGAYAENYRLPQVDADLTETKDYSILTTKNVVTVAQGGTGQTGTTTTSTIADIITAGSDVTITGASYAQWGKLAQLSVNFKNTNAINVTANGNITNLTIGTVVAGKRPATLLYGVLTGYADGVGTGHGYLQTNGNLVFTDFEARGAAYTIAAGTTLRVSAVYLLA